MSEARRRSRQPNDVRKPAHRTRLPGFVDGEIGLGDVVKHATRTIGIKPCGSCEERARKLNEWITFTGRRDDGTD
ncbi:hypothetical protein ACFU8W_49345 [Streptomyces sp. NPDC057565]|uniref:hypothetical protein n=1 Tax=Streptomyces sp. NPDC057565 TaxID=3346169 RepID=UPI0036A016A9